MHASDLIYNYKYPELVDDSISDKNCLCSIKNSLSVFLCCFNRTKTGPCLRQLTVILGKRFEYKAVSYVYILKTNVILFF